ncbi:MAG TPA: toll/interleukin-1 receptor domain-containing protein [Thermoanaerobaculia bacterium]|nr:toll/interleukin-1 receptor domain-containing protein [Thermoanaerobaculia bacterium]
MSYAHADDEPPMGAARGWVTTLADELRKMLRRKLGVREARIFMDHQLAGNEGVTEALLATVRGSRVLLLLMSPGYRRSNWCQWELGRFLAVQTERNHRDHVFIVETEPTDRAGWHPALQELIPIRFWHRDFEDKAPRLMGFPMPTPHEDNPYWRNLNELAHLIARQLEDLEAPPREPRDKVWLAEPTEDLLDEQESVAAALRQQGFLVVPAAPLPREGREPYLRSLHEGLERAILGVQLLGPREGHRPAWSDLSFVALQAAAAEGAARARGLRVLRWRSRAVDLDRVTNPEYRALLTGGSVLAQGIEELKQEVLRALNGATKPTPPDTPNPTGPAGAPHVYVNAEAVDRDLGRRVLAALEELGATSALPPLVSPHDLPDQIRRAQQDQLAACDGIVLVYGQAPPGWVQSQWAFARRTLAEQRRTLRAAVLDGPPSGKPPVDLRGPGILTLDCRAGFEPRILGDFVRQLRPDAVHA